MLMFPASEITIQVLVVDIRETQVIYWSQMPELKVPQGAEFTAPRGWVKYNADLFTVVAMLRIEGTDYSRAVADNIIKAHVGRDIYVIEKHLADLSSSTPDAPIHLTRRQRLKWGSAAGGALTERLTPPSPPLPLPLPPTPSPAEMIGMFIGMLAGLAKK